jgi:hypothetical protein
MELKSWILPTLIGIVASVLLLAILYNDPYVKSKFSDLGALIQLETSRPAYYGLGWVPVNGDYQLPPTPATGNITSVDSPLYADGPLAYPVYNYYPQTPLNPVPTQNALINKRLSVKNSNSSNTKKNTKHNNIQQTSQDLAFSNNQTYDAHKAYYWGLSGGYPYPYPFPMMYLPSTDMDKVKGVEDKI